MPEHNDGGDEGTEERSAPADPADVDEAILDVLSDHSGKTGFVADEAGYPEDVVAERLEALEDDGRVRREHAPTETWQLEHDQGEP